ncbi:hypothetical protein [Histidinibacterium aquaticum]|uniref:Uncharacterized protein n=1 Tax=Histidinibacterium aquaticum TaxID=2613962 RepID=A0A5J5GQD5_9RHOB|nr:hypothetical protein [Histidinibacterium aquaticum]KAA9010267.1 hypothetical protein F3S47_03175 [Histidinibacterium aquaticum]
MTRLIIGLLLFAVAALAVHAAGLLTRPRAGGGGRPARRSHESTEVAMPDSFRNISYAILLLLALGVTSGWLGGP